MGLSDFTFIPLSENINLSNFDCNDQDINGFHKDDALNYQQDNMANTYLFVSNDDDIMAYFSISTDSLNDMGEDAMKNTRWNRFHRKEKISNFKRIRSYPSIKIGRLGVCKSQQKTGISYELMDFIKGYSILDIKPACRLLLIDAYNKERQINYYKKNGFEFLKDDEEDSRLEKRTMFFSLSKLF